jgi:hypothetical protein
MEPIKSFRTGTEVGPKLGPKFTNAETEVGPKWDRNGTENTEMGPKWDRNGTEMGQKIGTEMFKKRFVLFLVRSWVLTCGTEMETEMGPKSKFRSPDFGPILVPAFSGANPISVPVRSRVDSILVHHFRRSSVHQFCPQFGPQF